LNLFLGWIEILVVKNIEKMIDLNLFLKKLSLLTWKHQGLFKKNEKMVFFLQ